jgi:colanic acid/amylovoran biosynthesis glycosyltransferase
MRIAYLVNQYPKVSHSFIRREILGLESQGVEVVRFSIRSLATELVDDADKIELGRTRQILDVGIVGLLWAVFSTVLTRPARFWQALRLALTVGWGSERGTILHLAYLAEACVLRDWLAQQDIAHIHAHFGTNSTTVAMLCRVLGGISYSFTVHGPEEFDKVQAIALSEKIDRAAFVVAISSYGKSQLYRWCPYAQWSKIHVVRCGVDRDFLNAPSIPLPETPQLVCVGRLSEQKGHALLIEAAARLAAEGRSFKLVLVGDGPLRSAIETEIARCNLQNHIEITGWASNDAVRQFILASRALVLPSFAEGLPVVIMEALALGRPVIGTYVAGIPELVEPGVCGWLVPAGSVTDLTAAMRTVLALPSDRLTQMGAAGTQRIAERHDVLKETEHLAQLFQTYSQTEKPQIPDREFAPDRVLPTR